jgi:hypothetical protein
MVTQFTLTVLALLDWRRVWGRGDFPRCEIEHNTSIPAVDLDHWSKADGGINQSINLFISINPYKKQVFLGWK